MENPLFDNGTIGALLERYVANSPGRRLKGATLGQLIRRDCPDFSFREATGLPLGSFVRVYARALQRNAATDEYALPSIPTEFTTRLQAAPMQPAQTPAGAWALPRPIWFAFSGASTNKVIVNTQDPELRTISANSTIELPWVEIARVSPEEHSEMARQFAEAHMLSEDVRGLIGKSPTWHKEFYAALRIEDRGTWRGYHNQRVLQLFINRLGEKGVDYSKCRLPWHGPATHFEPAPTGPTVSEAPRHEGHDKYDLRFIALRVVERLSVAELHRLRFELGDVLNVLNDTTATATLPK